MKNKIEVNSKVTQKEIENIEIQNNNLLLDIQFNGTWKPTKRFNDTFELVNYKGKVTKNASTHTAKYRFKIGMENLGNTPDVEKMFYNCKTLQNITLLSNWINITPIKEMFTGCDALTSISLKNNNPLLDIKFNEIWTPTSKFNEVFELVDDNGNVVNDATPEIKKYRFKIGMENWGKVTNAAYMFENCKALQNITLPDNWGEVKITQKIFYWCKALKDITLPDSWGKISSAASMFWGCEKLTNTPQAPRQICRLQVNYTN